MAGIALDDTAPPVGPTTPDLPVLGVAHGDVALPVSPAAMDDCYHLPAPLHEGDSQATDQRPALRLVDPAVEDGVAQEVQTAFFCN